MCYPFNFIIYLSFFMISIIFLIISRHLSSQLGKILDCFLDNSQLAQIYPGQIEFKLSKIDAEIFRCCCKNICLRTKLVYGMLFSRTYMFVFLKKFLKQDYLSSTNQIPFWLLHIIILGTVVSFVLPTSSKKIFFYKKLLYDVIYFFKYDMFSSFFKFI